MKKRILIVSDSYPPELRSASELMRDLAEGLSEIGHEVFVVTSYPKFNLAENTGKNFPQFSVENGVSVIRVKGLPHHKVNFVIRGIAQLILPILFYRAVRKNISGRLDFVILHSPPLPLSAVSAKIAKKYFGKYILNLHDFFPQNAVDLGILKNQLIIKFFEAMEARAYADAHKIVVPSEGHAKFLKEKRGSDGDKISVIPHWVDMSQFIRTAKTGKYRKLYNLEDKFIFLFAGVLGPSQGLDFILKIAKAVESNPKLHFLFVGDGMAKNSLVDMAKEMDLKNVSFEQFVSKEEYPLLVKDVDVGIISLTNKNTTPAVPAKLIGYMAGSLPIIGFLHAESDGSNIIKDAQCGFVSEFGDLEGAVNSVNKLHSETSQTKIFGENSFSYAQKHFSKEVCIEKWDIQLGEDGG